jgi:pleiotropic regulator 1
MSLLRESARRTRDIFAACPDDAAHDEHSARLRLAVKIADEYTHYRELPSALLAQQGPARPNAQPLLTSDTERMIAAIDSAPTPQPSTFATDAKLSDALTLHKTTRTVKPTYHAPWTLVRVISGHLGWVRSVAVEPGNTWFATGAGDRVIKIWDLASGALKLSLTGHISTVRGLAVSPRHPYLFSCGEDKVRAPPCLSAGLTRGRWSNAGTSRSTRSYASTTATSRACTPSACTPPSTCSSPVAETPPPASGTCAPRHKYTSSPATLPPSPTSNVRTLTHRSSPAPWTRPSGPSPSTLFTFSFTLSSLWDLAAGKTMVTLTHHKKSVRALAIHPTEYSFASGAAGGNNIKKWKCPEGNFVFNFAGHNAIINTLSVNPEGVFFSGGAWPARGGDADPTTSRRQWHAHLVGL